MKLLARVKISKIVPLLAEIKCQIRIGILKLLRWGKKRPEIGIFKNLILIFGIFIFQLASFKGVVGDLKVVYTFTMIKYLSRL